MRWIKRTFASLLLVMFIAPQAIAVCVCDPFCPFDGHRRSVAQVLDLNLDLFAYRILGYQG
jgi:hypothetical protein